MGRIRNAELTVTSIEDAPAPKPLSYDCLNHDRDVPGNAKRRRLRRGRRSRVSGIGPRTRRMRSRGRRLDARTHTVQRDTSVNGSTTLVRPDPGKPSDVS
ncbi:hypothetical protein GCM10022222_84680 [Amycolatopsis ultiminotia]|uniref:Uncharacterized protein n=1 Tax=Amycolatopsis ultiminotia TaxID=543629 RepID=A0ABP6YPK8_9PSEU